MANVEHSAITDPNIHEPKGVAAATSGQVYVADGAGSGNWQAQAGNPSTQVIVSDASDFPTPVSDVITLSANTIYLLDGDIDIGNDRFVLSANTVIRGLGSTLSTITSTTTGNLFTASNNFTLEGFAVNCSGATVFACTGGSTESAYLKEFTINTASAVGTFSAWYSLFWDKGAMVSASTGLVMSGACAILILDLVEFITGYTTGVDLGTATFNTCSFFRCGFAYASATAHIDIAASSANINAGKIGRIQHCTFNTSATNVVLNYNQSDLQWNVESNAGLVDSTKDAQGYMQTTTTTTIGAGDGDSGNPKLVNGATNWVDAVSDQFTITTGGRFTYTGLVDTVFLITCTISGTTASGTQTVNHYIAKNGTTITASKTQREYTSTAVGSPAPCNAIVSMSTNDYVELYIENTTGTNNFDHYILNMTIIERG